MRRSLFEADSMTDHGMSLSMAMPTLSKNRSAGFGSGSMTMSENVPMPSRPIMPDLDEESEDMMLSSHVSYQ